MTTPMQIIKSEWQALSARFNANLGVSPQGLRGLTLEHYKSLLREIYHNVKDHPQTLAMLTARLPRNQGIVKKLLQHALSEHGHDQLALNDLAALGEDVTRIPDELPLPATMALKAFGYYQIQALDPVGYLGYVIHLEFTPTSNGERYMQILEHIGVPKEAMTFIADHARIDVGHNKLMEQYVAELVTSEEQLGSVVYAMRVTAKLYANMIAEAFERADSTL